jgi:hypothetical protein
MVFDFRRRFIDEIKKNYTSKVIVVLRLGEQSSKLSTELCIGAVDFQLLVEEEGFDLSFIVLYCQLKPRDLSSPKPNLAPQMEISDFMIIFNKVST